MPDNNKKYDVFVSYSHSDKVEVLAIIGELKERGLIVFYDDDGCAPGVPFQEQLGTAIQESAAIAVMLGKGEAGTWVASEIVTATNEKSKRQMRIVPVILASAGQEPNVPIGLQPYTHVDFRIGTREDCISRLAWGITGVKPVGLAVQDKGEVVAYLVEESQKTKAKTLRQPITGVDEIGSAKLKRALHLISELAADEALQSAHSAAREFPTSALTQALPIFVAMRWDHSYKEALHTLLDIPKACKHLSAFELKPAEPECVLTSGLLSAAKTTDTEVLIQLNGVPAATVTVSSESEQKAVVESVNMYGRLGLRPAETRTLLERIGEVELVKVEDEKHISELAAELHSLRDTLIPLLARYRLPGLEWLLPAREPVPVSAAPLQPKKPPFGSIEDGAVHTDPTLQARVQEIVLSRRWKTRSTLRFAPDIQLPEGIRQLLNNSRPNAPSKPAVSPPT